MTAEVVDVLPVAVAGWLLLVGTVGIIRSRRLIHLVFCVSVVHASVWVLLIGLAHRPGDTAPVTDGDVAGRPLADPVLQALTVTDVVVNAAVTALLLALAVRVTRRRGTDDPRELSAMRG